MTLRRGVALLGAFLAIAFAFSACGGEAFPKAAGPATSSTTIRSPLPKDASPRAKLLSAVQRVTDEKTARFSLSVAISSDNPDDATTLTGSGVVDFVHRTMSAVIDDPDNDPESTEIRVVGDTAYGQTADGWQQAPVATAGPFEAPDADTYLQYLEGVSTDVRVDGRDTVRGDVTTRYVATIDLQQAATREKNPALVQAVAAFGTIKIPVTVWVDDQNRVRKMQMALDLSKIAGGFGDGTSIGLKMDMTFELYDFGVAVNVQAPAGAKDAATVAFERATQSDLRNALTAAKTAYTDAGDYGATDAELKQIEPSLDWGGKLTHVVSATLRSVCMAEVSKTGEAFAIYDSLSAGTSYAKAACPAAIGDTPPAGFGSRW